MSPLAEIGSDAQLDTLGKPDQVFQSIAMTLALWIAAGASLGGSGDEF